MSRQALQTNVRTWSWISGEAEVEKKKRNGIEGGELIELGG